MELVEIIRGAQDAMDRGDYRLAVAASSHVLEAFPSCLTAHRMLGEARLELGETDFAIEHFERAIAIDPLNVVARLGLGVAAEEKKDMGAAYAAYLHAWEINPALDQVRDELVRLRGLLGGEERLHPTRAGLAGIYARSGQFGRAAAEWRAVLMVEPESRRALTSLAEVLWRSGDDAAAAVACREALRVDADNSRALGMLADIETRRGNAAGSEMSSRYQFVDPAGEVVTLLAEWRDELDLSFLRRESVVLPDFDFAATPVQDRVPVATSVASVPVPSLGTTQFAAPDLWDTLVRDMVPGESVPLPDAPVDDDVLPFSWLDEPAPHDAVLSESFPASSLGDLRYSDPPAQAPSYSSPPVRKDSGFDLLESEVAAMNGNAPVDRVVEAPKPTPVERAVVAPKPVPIERAVAVEKPTPTAPTKRASDAFVTADGRVDLTVGWDDLDRQLKEATPDFQNAQTLDDMAEQFGVEGLQPFDLGETTFDDSAWAPFTDEDLAAPVAAAPQQAPAPVQRIEPAAPYVPPVGTAPVVRQVESDPVSVHDWDVDHEILSAIPSQQASGYTELLRHVDVELPQEIELDEDVDPFANPDSAGPPLEFEDLLAVTSSDGTSPLSESTPDDVLAAADRGQQARDVGTFDLPLDQSPFDLEELLREESALEELGIDRFVAERPSGIDELLTGSSLGDETGLGDDIVVEPVPDSHFDAVLAELGDLEPFSLDDAAFAGSHAESGDAVDFSDINEAPFDPASLSKVIVPPAPLATPDAIAWSASSAPVARENLEIESPWADIDTGPIGSAAEELAPLPVASPAAKKGSGGLGLPPGGVGWPAFVNHTSELIDRGVAGGNLYERLRATKQAAAAAGAGRVDRSLSDLRPQLVRQVVVEPSPVVPSSPPAPVVAPVSVSPARVPLVSTLSEDERLDLMAMRIRLIEDDGSAEEIARLLEAAVSRGLNDPLAMRVLGEAYLKLGRTEQAAAQFRQAMLARSRTR